MYSVLDDVYEQGATWSRASVVQERAETAKANSLGSYLEPERKASGDANLFPFHLHDRIQVCTS